MAPKQEQSQILVFRAAAGAGYRLSPRLSLGGTVGLVYNENTLVAPFIFQSNPQLKGLKTLLALHTRGFGWGGSLGVVAHPTAQVLLQAAYSSPYTVNGTGHASGNLGAQFAAAGIPFAPDYKYDAKVRVKLPQSVSVGGRWQRTSKLGLSLEGDWVNFRCAFDRLPVSLTHGNNGDINSFLGSDSIEDEVPLRWSDQFLARAAVDYLAGRSVRLAGGYTRRRQPGAQRNRDAADRRHHEECALGRADVRPRPGTLRRGLLVQLQPDGARRHQRPALGRVRPQPADGRDAGGDPGGLDPAAVEATRDAAKLGA